MTRSAGVRGKVVGRMMITLLFTMMVVGVVQYVAVDRALTHHPLIQLAAGAGSGRQGHPRPVRDVDRAGPA